MFNPEWSGVVIVFVLSDGEYSGTLEFSKHNTQIMIMVATPFQGRIHLW